MHTDYTFSLIYKSRLYKNESDKCIKYQFLVSVTGRLHWFSCIVDRLILRFRVLAAVSAKITVLEDVVLCSLVQKYTCN
jgi:hypothetical protein